MFITQYTHRLPADYDMGRIRKRAAERGPYWDRYPGLIFKGFLVQEIGRSSANAYSSLYLWRDAEAFTAMVTEERFQAVIDAFGRPAVETFATLAFAKGPASSARFVRRVDELVPQQADLQKLREAETQAALQQARSGGTLAALAALDVTNWRLARFLLSEAKPAAASANATDYEIAYFASPPA